MAPRALPARARIVIIGGGVAGGAIAFHLAELGETDVVVLERHELTSGSTFHSAGLVGQLRGSLPLTRMMMHSVETYRRLEAMGPELGTAPGWTEIGSLRIASSDERMEELRRQHGWSKTFGLDMELLSPRECQQRFPLMTLEGVRGGIFLPTDGHLDPSSLTNSFFAAAKRSGVSVHTHTRVTGFGVESTRSGAGQRVTRVDTDLGSIECEAVIAACGMYTTEVAALLGVNVPIVPMAHQYLITKPIEGVTADLPSMRDPDNLVYFRNQGGGLVAGGYERDPAPWSLHGVPFDFNYRLLDEDWDRFAPLMESAITRVPAIEQAQIIQLLNGPEGFTPDNEFILGPSEVDGFFVAAGFCAHGIAGAGGVGRVMAEWVLEGTPSIDCWKMDIRRFGGAYSSRDFTRDRTVEVYSTYYDIHYPNEERQAGRPLRRSAAYPALAALGCSFGEKSMWERPNWFEPNAGLDVGVDLEAQRPHGWAGRHWHPAIAAEAIMCRRTAALFDESSFAKLAVNGPTALALLQRLCDNDIDRAVGSIVYTQLLNERGGIECDLTITRLADDQFQIVTGTAFANHDLGWIRRQATRLPEGSGATITDVTAGSSVLGIWGPQAETIVQQLTSTDMTQAAFPYLTAQRCSIGPVPTLASRVTFVGESGWELMCGTEFGATMWDLLFEAGRDHQLVAGGYRAIDSLRLEKGYRVWGADVTPDDTPDEAGLGFCVRTDRGEFIGRDAVLAGRADGGPARRLVCLILDDTRTVAMGSEPVRSGGGEILGRVTSGGQGHATGTSIAYAYVPTELAKQGTRFEVEVFGDWVGATVSPVPHDPKGLRVRA